MKCRWTAVRVRSEVLAALCAALCVASVPCAVSAEEEPSGGFEIDHESTRFPLTGAHERVACESCHQQGLFEGTPILCQYCHAGSGLRAETGKPRDHIPSSNQCLDCHTTRNWAEARFDHFGVSGRCDSCHNRIFATGKPRDHLRTNADCGECHRTLTWSGARFDHSNITGSCASCHNGRTARGKPGDHPRTNADCGVCHRTSTWDDARFDHANVTGNCASCHNGRTATGKDGDHFDTNLDCVRCHGTSNWQPVRFDHAGAAYPGDHRGNLACLDCHRNNAARNPWTFPGLAPDCGGCHQNDFRAGPHKKVDSPRILYTASELRDCSGACHRYTDATFSVIERRRDREHRVSDGDF